MPATLDRLVLQTDEELVARAQQGDEEAFGELMRRTSPASLKLAVSILRDVAAAEDEVQDSYWKAWRNLGRFEGRARFSTWMNRIVVNQCLMRLRQFRREKEILVSERDGGEGAPRVEARDRQPDPEEGLGNRQMQGLLRREIARLPPMFREVLVMRELQEKSLREIAVELGATVAAVKARLFRAREELRQRVEKSAMGGNQGSSLTAPAV